jgi:hypothetical protein
MRNGSSTWIGDRFILRSASGPVEAAEQRAEYAASGTWWEMTCVPIIFCTHGEAIQSKHYIGAELGNQGTMDDG